MTASVPAARRLFIAIDLPGDVHRRLATDRIARGGAVAEAVYPLADAPASSPPARGTADRK